jgi:hypothetical protein
MSEASSTPPSSRIPLSDHHSSPDTIPAFRNPISTLQRPRDQTITTIPPMTPRTLSPTKTTSRRRASGLPTQARRPDAQCPAGERLRTRPVMRGVAQPTDKENSSTSSSPSPSETAVREQETSTWLTDQTLPSGPRFLPVAALHSQGSDYPVTLDEGLSSGEGSAAGTPPPLTGDRQG